MRPRATASATWPLAVEVMDPASATLLSRDAISAEERA
jgi:hypothetical protein